MYRNTINDSYTNMKNKICTKKGTFGEREREREKERDNFHLKSVDWNLSIKF